MAAIAARLRWRSSNNAIQVLFLVVVSFISDSLFDTRWPRECPRSYGLPHSRFTCRNGMHSEQGGLQEDVEEKRKKKAQRKARRS